MSLLQSFSISCNFLFISPCCLFLMTYSLVLDLCSCCIKAVTSWILLKIEKNFLWRFLSIPVVNHFQRLCSLWVFRIISSISISMSFIKMHLLVILLVTSLNTGYLSGLVPPSAHLNVALIPFIELHMEGKPTSRATSSISGV